MLECYFAFDFLFIKPKYPVGSRKIGLMELLIDFNIILSPAVTF